MKMRTGSDVIMLLVTCRSSVVRQDARLHPLMAACRASAAPPSKGAAETLCGGARLLFARQPQIMTDLNGLGEERAATLRLMQLLDEQAREQHGACGVVLIVVHLAQD